MFDRITVSQQKDRLVPYEKTIHNHHAPTEKTAKYLDDLRKQAFNDVIQAFVVSASIADFHFPEVLVTARKNLMEDNWVLAIHTKTKLLARVTVEPWDIHGDLPDRAMGVIRDKIAQSIADKLVLDNINQIARVR